jgi:hypothetical protein
MTHPRAIVTAALVALFINPIVARPASANSSPSSSRPAPSRAAAEQAEATSPLEGLEGHYRFSGGEREIQARDQAIDDIVDGMSWLVRGTARSRLKKLNTIPRTITLDVHGDALTMTLPDAVYEAPLDGSPVRVKGPSGDPVELRHAVIGKDRLRQSFSDDDGIRVNFCDRRGDDHIRIVVVMRSDKLPKDLTYELTFRRAD